MANFAFGTPMASTSTNLFPASSRKRKFEEINSHETNLDLELANLRIPGAWPENLNQSQVTYTSGNGQLSTTITRIAQTTENFKRRCVAVSTQITTTTQTTMHRAVRAYHFSRRVSRRANVQGRRVANKIFQVSSRVRQFTAVNALHVAAGMQSLVRQPRNFEPLPQDAFERALGLHQVIPRPEPEPELEPELAAEDPVSAYTQYAADWAARWRAERAEELAKEGPKIEVEMNDDAASDISSTGPGDDESFQTHFSDDDADTIVEAPATVRDLPTIIPSFVDEDISSVSDEDISSFVDDDTSFQIIRVVEEDIFDLNFNESSILDHDTSDDSPDVRLRRSQRLIDLELKKQEEEEKRAEENRRAEEARRQAEENRRVEAERRRAAEEEAARKADEERQRKPFEPLTEAQITEVADLLKKGFGEFKPQDVARLVPTGRGGSTEGWLNDEVINAYLNMIAKHGNQGLPATRKKYHAFNSFFYKNIAEKGYDSVSRWGKRAKLEPQTINNMEAIFVPVNSGNHWTLLVIKPATKTVAYYDSMNGSGLRAMAAAKAWLAGELKAQYVESQWTFVASAQSPQQDNYSDCGVFTITTAKMLTLNINPLVYGPADIPMQRKRIVMELNGGKLVV